jgi:hypothetical protein
MQGSFEHNTDLRLDPDLEKTPTPGSCPDRGRSCRWAGDLDAIAMRRVDYLAALLDAAFGQESSRSVDARRRDTLVARRAVETKPARSAWIAQPSDRVFP